MAEYILRYDDELHREAKVRAAQEGITIKELMIKALKQYLKKKGGRWFYGNDLQKR